MAELESVCLSMYPSSAWQRKGSKLVGRLLHLATDPIGAHTARTAQGTFYLHCKGLIGSPEFCAAGDLDAACELRRQMIRESGDAGFLQCLPLPLRQWAAWVLRTANSQTVDIVELRGWHRALLEAVGSATAR